MIDVLKYNSLVNKSLQRNGHLILWTCQAKGEIRIDNKSFALGPANLITIGSRQKFEFVSGSIDGYVIAFDDADFPKSSIDSVCRIVLLYNYFNIHNQLIISEDNKQEFEQFFMLMHNEAAAKEKKMTNPILSLLLQTLVLKMEHVIRQNIPADAPKNNIEEKLLMEFLELLEANFSSKHKVIEYAELMSISSRKLNEMIKFYFGISVKNLISTRIYIEIARKLQFSSESVKEIAYELGFSSPYHLSHFFTQTKGISPQAYRDLLKK